MSEFNDLLEWFYLGIFPDTGVLGGDPALWEDGCCFYDSEAWSSSKDAADCR